MVDVATTSTPLPGSFVRLTSTFRDWVTADGSSGYPAEAGPLPPLRLARLPVGAPDADRPRALKRLEDASAVDRRPDPRRARLGLHRRPARPRPAERLPTSSPRPTPRPTRRSTAASPCRCCGTSETGRIVNNESADIIRMLDTRVRRVRRRRPRPLPRRPAPTRSTRVNERVYDGLNNGVYRAGFATHPGRLRRGRRRRLRRRSTGSRSASRDRRYLFGDRASREADWRLFTTLCASTRSTHGHFKCNLRRIVDYPNLWPATCATSTSARASPRRSTSTTSSATTTARTTS